MTDSLNIPRAVAQIVFDTAVGSMDFGSGFLDTEEVIALRTYAEILGVDPHVATPSNYHDNYYPGGRDPRTEYPDAPYWNTPRTNARCEVCRAKDDKYWGGRRP